MSKHNYSQYSSKNNNPNRQNNNQRKNTQPKQEEIEKIHTSATSAETVKIEPTSTVMHETVETVPIPEIVEGMVVNCAKLNVRENATVDSDIVCVLDSMSEIRVDVGKSTTKWAYIYTATGREGYCMRQYIEAHL